MTVCGYMVLCCAAITGRSGDMGDSVPVLGGGGHPSHGHTLFDTHCKDDQEGHKSVRPVLREVTAHHGICSCAGV
jgi:hypothetical protein